MITPPPPKKNNKKKPHMFGGLASQCMFMPRLCREGREGSGEGGGEEGEGGREWGVGGEMGGGGGIGGLAVSIFFGRTVGGGS